MAMTTPGKNRIMIFRPKEYGTYVVEFRTPKPRRWRSRSRGARRRFAHGLCGPAPTLPQL